MQLSNASFDTAGKLVGDKHYLHIDALPEQADSPTMQALLARVAEAEALAGVRRGEHFNLIRLEAGGNTLALLHYPGFADDPFPALAASWRVDLDAGTVGFRTYADSLNPPILHRKELLPAADDPGRAAWAELTAACELGRGAAEARSRRFLRSIPVVDHQSAQARALCQRRPPCDWVP